MNGRKAIGMILGQGVINLGEGWGLVIHVYTRDIVNGEEAEEYVLRHILAGTFEDRKEALKMLDKITKVMQMFAEKSNRTVDDEKEIEKAFKMLKEDVGKTK